MSLKHKTRRAHKTRKPSSTPFGPSISPVYGESSLWGAVITQALMDALSKARHSEASFNKDEAIRWLTSNSTDFITVCQFAGYDPDYVRKKAKKAIANPVPWRAEPGKGKRYLERREYRRKQKDLSEKSNACSFSMARLNTQTEII